MRSLTLFLVLFSFALNAQMPEGYRHFDPASKTARALAQRGNHHDHIRPLNPFLERDRIALTPDSAFADTTHTRFRIREVLDLSGGASLHPSAGLSGVGGAGFDAELHIGNRWFFRAGYQLAYLHFPDHLEVLESRRGIVAGMGVARDWNGVEIAHVPTGTVGLRIGDHFSLEAGRDKHFWGDGYRSAVLSHNTAPYPFAKLTTQFWKIKYVNLWGAMRDLNLQTGERRNKFTALHALSWNASRRVNFSVYEAVVWQTTDESVNRGFDFAYLNPFIFYRPVEFAKGSADNMLLGFSTRVEISPKLHTYAQLYFDEIKIEFLRARNGWWANKFAIQIGVKGWDLFTEGHRFLTEFNITRPFTYTHGSVIQAYGHDAQELAHPMGANFAEWVTRNQFTLGQMELTSNIIWAAYARNSAGQNLGNEVFTSYTGPFQQFNNSMFQGERHTLLFVETEAAWPIKNDRLYAFASNGIRKVWNTTDSPFDLWFQVGLRTNLVRPYRDF